MKVAARFILFFFLATALCQGCRKKHATDRSSFVETDPYLQDKEGLRPVEKIDPEGEAERPPQLAVADLPKEDDDLVEPDNTVVGAGVTKVRSSSDYSLATIGHYQIVRLFASRFSSVPKRARALSYHLARAVLAGRDIAFDQLHKDGLEVRQLFECILRLGKNSERLLDQALRDYYLRLGINGGFYDRITGKKFTPGMSFDDFVKAVRAAHADGAHMELQRDESIDGMLSRLRRIVFDARFQSKLLQGKRGGWQGNAVGGAPLNLYKGVRSKALRRFDEQYPQNSRLINIEGKLVEDVYRTGDRLRRIPPGRYSSELKRVIGRLQAALATADHKQRMVLTNLIEHFRTGDTSSFDSALSLWQDQAWPVEFFMGFLDKNLDYQQQKGIWTGWVGLRCPADTLKLESLARNLKYFEDRMPWDSRFRNHWKNLPRIAAVELLTGAGSIFPICNVGYRIPPDRTLGERFCPKSLFFSNVEQARLHAVIEPIVQNFMEGKERQSALGSLDRISWTTRALAFVLGPSLGKISQSVGSWIRSDLVVVAKVRTELVALWTLADPKLQDLGLLLPVDDPMTAWRVEVVQAAVLDALSPKVLVDTNARSRRVWIRKMFASGAVEFKQEQEKVFPVIRDGELFRKVLSELLVTSENILSSGDEMSAHAFVRIPETKTALAQREDLAKQAAMLGLGSTMVCVMPKLKPLRGDRPGRFTDASISFDEGFAAQLLRISRY